MSRAEGALVRGPEPGAAPGPVLRMRALVSSFPRRGGGEDEVLRGLDLDVRAGETVGLVGDSGSGKSLTALAALGMKAPGQRLEGSVELGGRELIGASEADLRRVRGAAVGLVLQDPIASLSPSMRVGDQIIEAIQAHLDPGREEARRRAVELLREVGIPEPERRYHFHPHQLSGGMCQRAMLAIALSCDPALLVADEPTTSLDAPTQERILDLIGRLARDRGLAVLLVSHDPAVVGRLADRVLVLEDGRLRPAPVESPPPVPALPRQRAPADGDALLRVEGLTHSYEVRDRLGRRSEVVALRDFDLRIGSGRFVGLVGPSGSGKSTLALCLVRLIEPDEGRIVFDGLDVAHLGEKELRPFRSRVSIVFQSPLASLNPRRRVAQIVASPLSGRAPRDEARRRALAALDAAGVPAELVERRPAELSGGQRQRVSLARALVTEPELLICDEPVSSLDATARDRFLALLAELRDRTGMACLMISHDRRVVGRLCDEVVELGRPGQGSDPSQPPP